MSEWFLQPKGKIGIMRIGTLRFENGEEIPYRVLKDGRYQYLDPKTDTWKGLIINQEDIHFSEGTI